MDPITFGKKIKQYYPQYAQIDDAELGNKFLQKYGPALDSVKGGQLKISDIPEKQKIAVGFGLNTIGFKPAEVKPQEQQKQEQKLSTIDVSVGELEKQLNQIGGASRGK